MAEKIICVVGPTACGKTKLGVLLAKRYDGEVVSADSMQIYKGMTIGTAAPTAEEMEGVPHHMIAVADPAEQWSAARYARAAVPIVDDILRRGKRPILVGGTGLWLDAVVQGRTFAGGHAGGAVRRELQAQLAREGIGPLLEELRQVDPEAAERLHPADEKRILRALEVYRETGKTISAHNAETRDLPPRYDAVWTPWWRRACWRRWGSCWKAACPGRPRLSRPSDTRSSWGFWTAPPRWRRPWRR